MGITLLGTWPFQSWQCAALKAPHVVSVCTVQPVDEPLSVEEGKLRAGLTWPSGAEPPDPRDALMLGFIKAARAKVEKDTGLSLLEQTRAVYLDVVTGVITLPWLCMPLQEVSSIVAIAQDGSEITVDPATYIVDKASGRIALKTGAQWPSNLQSFQPWTITVVVGWATPEDLANDEPMLLQAVGLLTAHLATIGRDLAATPTPAVVPLGYDDMIQPYAPIAVV